jgi:hypothetical protein
MKTWTSGLFCSSSFRSSNQTVPVRLLKFSNLIVTTASVLTTMSGTSNSVQSRVPPIRSVCFQSERAGRRSNCSLTPRVVPVLIPCVRIQPESL